MSKEKKSKPQSTLESEAAVQGTAPSKTKAKSKAKSPLLANDKEKRSAKQKTKAVDAESVDNNDVAIESENITEKLTAKLKSKHKKKEKSAVSVSELAQDDELLEEDTASEIQLSSEEFEEMAEEAALEAKMPIGIIEQSEEDFFEGARQPAYSNDSLINQIEALIFSAAVPLSVDKIMKSLDDTKPAIGEVRTAIDTLRGHYEHRGVHLVEVASGWRFQVALSCAPTIVKTLAEKPSRLSRALLETLALVAYRQPITRAEIESIRGVVVSTQMVKTLLDHEWIRVVGHKDVPGKPALYATTKTFLDDMGLTKLDELPPLSEIKSMLPQEATKVESQPQSLEEISQLMANAQLIDETEEAIDSEMAELEILEQESIAQSEEPQDLAAFSGIERLEDLDEFSSVLASETSFSTETHAVSESVAVSVDFEQESIDALVDELRNLEQSRKETQKQNDEMWSETTESLESTVSEADEISDLLPASNSLIDDINEEVVPDDEEHN